MKYKNASEVLPKEILLMVQQYVQGKHLYVPIPEEEKSAWGEQNGTKEKYIEHNKAIKSDYYDGHDLINLSEKYCLTVETLKKIIYTK